MAETIQLNGLVTSVRVTPTTPHVVVRVFVSHASTGALVMRTKEAKAFVAFLQRAQRLEAAAAALVLDEAFSEDEPPTVTALRAALDDDEADRQAWLAAELADG